MDFGDSSLISCLSAERLWPLNKKPPNFLIFLSLDGL